MSYTITDNTVTLRQQNTHKANLFLRLFAEQVVATSTPKTPKKTGRLRMDVVKSVLGHKGKIVWGKKYAKFQETKQYRNYTTAGTGPGFASNAITETVKQTGSIAKKAGLT